jgi:hypothetical protein
LADTPVVVFFINTDAKGIGLPSSLVILPLILNCWAYEEKFSIKNNATKAGFI